MSTYRLRITYVYSSTTNATTAATNINNVLSGWSNPTLSQRAVRTSATLDLLITGLTEAQATSLHAALNTAAHSTARTGGKFSLVRTPDLD